MRFDDRLATVLAQPASDPHDRNVRWRQLVDLIARADARADRGLLERALAVLDADRDGVPEHLRAAAARAIAGLPIPAALLEHFAADSAAVAAPLIAAARIEGDSLARLRAAASDEVSRLLDSLHGPPPPAASKPEAEPRPGKEAGDEPSIADVIARLDRLRSARAGAAAERPAPADEGPALFRWECNASGEIDWVEGVPRGPLIGRSIAVADADEGVDDCVERAFAIRAPFRDCRLDLAGEGQLAGDWAISGAPAFAPADGRFVGYRGVARRGAPELAPQPRHDPLPLADSAHESLREMIHEIRTPLNAIIGFAEIIDGQYFGPAHRRYRERAAEIVGNARILLEAADDLDFVARSRADGSAATARFAQISEALADRLRAAAAERGVALDVARGAGSGHCAMDAALGERLIERFVQAVLAAAGPGERLALAMRDSGGTCTVEITRPRATLLATRQDLLDPEFTVGGEGRALLGLGFSLRLVTGLVELAGGAFDIAEDRFVLTLASR